MNTDSTLNIIAGKPNSVILETVRPDRGTTRTLLFSDPIEIIQAHSAEEIIPSFQRIEAALRKRYYLAGYVSYECGNHFEGLPSNIDIGEPLLWFGVYEKPLMYDLKQGATRQNIPEQPALSDLVFSLSPNRAPATLEEYSDGIRQIKNHIREGDVYQINYTGRMHVRFEGSPFPLYESLKEKQRVRYAGYLQAGETTILSLSPELFFRRNGNTITVCPMKGTAKRGRTVTEDTAIKTWLTSDMKSRAENVMIVDVLRNDLGKIAETGTVTTSSLYDIEQYDTLFQMTSTIEAQLRTAVSYYEIFKALFPSGSVTGAPKRRAMEIIQELETTSRGVYTGAIGFISPDDEAVFNVAIRTVVLNKDSGQNRESSSGGKSVQRFHGTMGTGGGIVWDSNEEEEFKECNLKARFLSMPYEEFQLIETMLWKNGYQLLDLHLDRLKESAAYFDFPYDEHKITEAIHNASRRKEGGLSYRIRLTLNKEGKIEIETSVLSDEQKDEQLHIRIAEEQTDSFDRFLFHKTTNRKMYDNALLRAQKEGFADLIFLNDRGEITEGAISNIFIKKGDKYFTPPIECGLLNGVYRQYLLKTLPDVR